MNTAQDVSRDLPPDATEQGGLQAAPSAYRGRQREWEARDVYHDPRRKSLLLATLLSAMPGLGQIYIGYYRQGFINILVVAALITALSSRSVGNLEPLLGLFLAFFWLYNVVDAYRRAALYNLTLEGVGPGVLPEEMPAAGGGSLAGGVALVALGLLLFANTMFNLSMEWVRQWWPIALVGIGLYLIFLSLRSRQNGGTGK